MNSIYGSTYPVLDVVWASLPLPALLVGPDDRISEVNPAGEIFLNASNRSLMGQHVFDRILIDTTIKDAIKQTRVNQSPLFIHDVNVTTGERRTVQCNVQVTQMHNNSDVIMMIISPLDIAYRLGRSMHAKSAAKSAIGMAEILAHEIKNPLAGISGAAQLLSMGLSPKDSELADLIVKETRRIMKLLEQVEQFGNVRSPELRAVNIHDPLDRARKSAMVGLAAHMHIFEDYDPSLPPTYADPDQLTQVFLNLINNAAGACQRSGEGTNIQLRTFYDLSLRLRGKDSTSAALPLQIEIIDNGPGIPPELMGEIFEPFVSGRKNGTGLGLALVSKIISDHEGLISVDSVPGHTVFRVSLPIVPRIKKEQV